MILTTTCNAEEFEAIRAAAIRSGLQVTAAPGFIYKKGNWIVGNTLEDEAHFNARVESMSLTPHEFMGTCTHKEEDHIRSMFIVCENIIDRNDVIKYFIEKGYTEPSRHIRDGLAICIIPAEKTLMVAFEYTARQNAKEGYTMIDFETFKTIVG
jgi:hypothetical protein